MKSHKPRSRKSHRISKPPRFDHRTAIDCRPATRAGLHLDLRYRVNPAIADVVAGLAGLGADSGESLVATVKPEGSDN